MSALAAAQAGTLGVGFSGAGYLIYFYFGVVDVLQRQLGVIKTDMPQAGASAGSLMILATTGLTPFDTLVQETNKMADRCPIQSQCLGTLYDGFKGISDGALPKDMTPKKNAYVAITTVGRGDESPPQTRLVNEFTGRDDLVEANGASCFIPYFAGPRLVTTFRGEEVYDGGLNGNGVGYLPCPPGISRCLRISSMPAGIRLGELLLKGLLLGDKPHEIMHNNIHIGSALANAAGNLPLKVASMIEAYSQPGAIKSEMKGLPQFQEALAAVVTPGEGEADIFPGRRHPLPEPQLTFASRLMVAPDPAVRRKLFDLGQKEAWSWAEENGFVADGRKLAPTMLPGLPPPEEKQQEQRQPKEQQLQEEEKKQQPKEQQQEKQQQQQQQQESNPEKH